jgi:hypothetical protein
VKVLASLLIVLALGLSACGFSQDARIGPADGVHFGEGVHAGIGDQGVDVGGHVGVGR